MDGTLLSVLYALIGLLVVGWICRHERHGPLGFVVFSIVLAWLWPLLLLIVWQLKHEGEWA